MFIEVLEEALIDTLKVIPFLFLAYLLLEATEHRAEEHSVKWVDKAGKWGPVIGSALGVIPQCGFSAATTNLYAGGVITRGTMLAVFLSTSDEMLPILISRHAPGSFILNVLAFKFLVGLTVGFLVDLTEKRHQKPLDKQKSIEDLCEQEGCNCEDGVLKSAVFHTLKITAFLFVTSLIMGLFVEAVGPEHLAHFILNKPVAGELLSGLVGIIPNCAASVIITELYLSGGMSLGAMLSGLLVSAGVGILVLFRINKDVKDNLLTVGLLYAAGVIFGLLADFIV